MTARAALTTLQIIDDERLVARAAASGGHALARMAEMAQGSAGIAGGRGLGLLPALELTPGRGLARHVVANGFAEGVSTVTNGPDAVGFSAPLTISTAEIDDALERLQRAATKADREAA